MTSAATNSVSVDTELLEKLNATLSGSVDDYLKKLTAYQNSYETVFFQGSPPKELSREYVDNRHCADCSLNTVRTVASDGSTVELVRALNSAYCFQLTRRGSGWMLQEYRMRGPDKSLVQPFVTLGSEIGLRSGSPYYVYLHWLPDWIRAPGFQWASLQRSQPTGSSYVRGDFRYRPIGEESEQIGTVVLDPDHYWCVMSFDLKNQRGGTSLSVSRQNEFVDLEPGFPIMRRSITRYRTEANGQHEEQRSESVTQWEFVRREAAMSEFTLSAFGLPEPAENQPRARWYLWFGGLGLLCLFVGLGVRALARRRGFASSS